MSAVGVSESGVRPILAEAVELARRALLELEPVGVGAHLGVTAEDDAAATHHFQATLPGYHGWQWAVVVAAPPEATHATVSESALLPGPDALVAPDFLPWDQRIRPGDLAPGDLLAPRPDDPRLVPGYVVTGDPIVDDTAAALGLGRPQVLSREGREEAADRWFSEFGPDTDMARAAPSTCGVCGFFVPLAGSLQAAFGVCANAMGADGRVVHVAYGCGAHSDTVVPTGNGSPLYEAYDDAAVEVIPAEELRRPEPEPVAAEPETAAEVLEPAAGEVAVADTEAAVTGTAAAVADTEAASADTEAAATTDADTSAAEANSPTETAAALPTEADVADAAVIPESATAETASVLVPAPASNSDAPEQATAPESAGALFDIDDADARNTDAWVVTAVKVESEASEPGSPESR